jgi:hypothetical protein
MHRKSLYVQFFYKREKYLARRRHVVLFFFTNYLQQKNKGRLGGPSREGPGIDLNEMG